MAVRYLFSESTAAPTTSTEREVKGEQFHCINLYNRDHASECIC